MIPLQDSKFNFSLFCDIDLWLSDPYSWSVHTLAPCTILAPIFSKIGWNKTYNFRKKII